jgi:DNA polymerase
MPSDVSAADFLPAARTLSAARRAATTCRGCHLYKNATQTVFGAGPKRAPVMLVGEQPGDQEDRIGQPFVGPAGRLLDRALEEAGIDRAAVYVTNVVKHFKWEPRGKRRIHRKPDSREIGACMPWLELEASVVRPTVLVCLGATAGRAVLGAAFKVTRDRGQWREGTLAPHVMGTIHPSAVLRLVDSTERERELKRFVDDLARVSALLR